MEGERHKYYLVALRDFASKRVALDALTSRQSAAIVTFLVAAWRKLGLPGTLQLEATAFESGASPSRLHRTNSPDSAFTAVHAYGRAGHDSLWAMSAPKPAINASSEMVDESSAKRPIFFMTLVRSSPASDSSRIRSMRGVRFGAGAAVTAEVGRPS